MKQGISILSVEKADCILVVWEGTSLLIDTAYRDSYQEVADLLAEKGVSSLDYLIISHYDQDHVGSGKKILKKFPVKQVFCPDYLPASREKRERCEKFWKTAEKEAVPLIKLQEVQEITFPQGSFTCYPSPCIGNPQISDENEFSLILSLRLRKGDGTCRTFLFTGDAETHCTRHYLDTAVEAHDFVKIPHHGSRDPLTKAFKNQHLQELLEKTQARFAVVTCLEETEREVLSQLQALAPGCQFRSNLQGTVELESFCE